MSVDTASTENVLRAWVSAELEPWRKSPMDRQAAERLMRETAERDERVCLFRLADGKITIDPFIIRERPGLCDAGRHDAQRVAAYLAHFRDAVRLFEIRGDALLAMYIADGYPDDVKAPMLCFQKPSGAAGMLVPDIDLLSYDYCLNCDGPFNDPIPFDDKRPEAIFVGSTTGARLSTVADIWNGVNERIDAGLFFRDRAGVTFRLPNVVQCGTKVRAAIDALGITGRKWTWDEQHAYRYMLSLDGNGATCSRVAAALHGHQVLAKYDSPNVLYYFRGLKPGRHFVSIARHEHVLELLVEAEAAHHSHQMIAVRGRRFAQQFLTRQPILRYTALLLAAYVARFGENGSALGRQAPLIDCVLGLAGEHPRWGEYNGWDGVADQPIEHVTFFPYGFDAQDLVCEGIGFDGMVATVSGGQRCGTPGTPLAGVRLRLTGTASRDWAVSVKERFADGSFRDVPENGPLLPAYTPLIGFAVAMRPIVTTRPRRFPWPIRLRSRTGGDVSDVAAG